MEHSLRPPLPAIAGIFYLSMIAHATPLFASFQIQGREHVPQAANDLRPELIAWDTK